MKKIFRILSFLAVFSAVAFAEEISPAVAEQTPDSSSAADSLQTAWTVDLGASFGGGFGLWNIKLDQDHLRAPQFGFDISTLVGYGHFALRLSAIGKYQAVYISEGTFATIYEGFWRLGGGLAARFQLENDRGFWTELGASALAPLKKNITLCEGMHGAKFIHWELKSQVEVPLELALGYRIPLGPIFLDLALYGAYDLNHSMTFRVNENERDARAWNIGGKLTLWAVRF